MNKTEMLNQLRFDYGFKNMEWCSDEENKQYSDMLKNDTELPDNISQDEFSKGRFYRIIDCDLSYEEKMEFLKYKELELIEEQTRKISTIRKISIFYLVCSVIVAVGALIKIF